MVGSSGGDVTSHGGMLETFRHDAIGVYRIKQDNEIENYIASSRFPHLFIVIIINNTGITTTSNVIMRWISAVGFVIIFIIIRLAVSVATRSGMGCGGSGSSGGGASVLLVIGIFL